MSRACLLHPENVCRLDAEGKCVCAPPGSAHGAECATARGEKCDCQVARAQGMRLLDVFNPNLRIFG